MNSTIVLNRIVAARNEGGRTSAIDQAGALVEQYYPGRTFDHARVVGSVLDAVDRFDQAGAETVINEALAALRTPEPVVATDEAVAVDTTVGADHEARLVALEQIARNNGYGHDLAVPNGVGSHEARLTALENLARRANLR